MVVAGFLSVFNGGGLCSIGHAQTPSLNASLFGVIYRIDEAERGFAKDGEEII